MAKLTVSDAARVTGVSRMLLYRYIKTGKLSRTPDGFLDTAELLRVGLVLQTSDVMTPVTMLHDVTSPSPTVVTPVVTPAVTGETTALERLVTVLQRELDEAHTREQVAQAREARYQEQIAQLAHLVEQMQHRYDRLLEAPRSVPAPSAPAPLVRAPADTAPPTHVVSPHSAPFPSRGAARQRILALLREYPAGLTAVELRVLLGAEKSLTDTCAGMFKNGLLRRVGRGRYVGASVTEL